MKKVLHILHDGQTLCGRKQTPRLWWLPLWEWPTATCATCRKAARTLLRRKPLQ